MSYISRVHNDSITYDIRDRRIPEVDASQDAGKVIAVTANGTLEPTASASTNGLVLDSESDTITQAGVDVTDDVKDVLELDSKADLVDGKVPQSQLPSYVDDVVEVQTFADLPVIGESGKIYVTLNNNLTYRWSGSAYVEISQSLALGITHESAYYGDLGNTAYLHTLNTENPHHVTADQIGISVNNVKPDATGNIQIDEVKFAEDLASPDNQEDIDEFIFRTSGGHASIHTGEATLGYIEGNSYIVGLDSATHHATSIIMPKPIAFRSILFNQFDKGDETLVFEDQSFDNNGNFVYNSGTYAAIVHVVGGIVAGNGNKGYTAAWLSENNVAIPNVESAFVKAGWLAEKPTLASTGIKTLADYAWVTGGQDMDGNTMPERLNITLDYQDPSTHETSALPNGYLIIITRDINHLCVHPRWSGYMDGIYASYKDDSIFLPMTDTSKASLPIAQYGFPSLPLANGSELRDHLSLAKNIYTKNVGYLPYSEANLSSVVALGVEYIYDNNTILYELTTPETFTIEADELYEVDDFGTEEFIFEANTTEIPIVADCWYGQSLKNKLRTDVVTISEQRLTSSQQAQVRSNIGAIGASEKGVANGIATLGSDGKLTSSQMPSDVVKSVNGIDPDSTGDVTINQVPLAQNLLSPDNISDGDTYYFRTAGGVTSISDGEAQIVEFNGNSDNPTREEEVLDITTYDAVEGTKISVSINRNTWRENSIVGAISGKYVFKYDGTVWRVTCAEAGLVSQSIDIASCGITLSGTPALNDTILINHTRTNNAFVSSYSPREASATIDGSAFATQATTDGFGSVVDNPINFTCYGNTWTGVQNIAPYYNDRTYEVGHLVSYDGDIYECNTIIETPEEFDSTKWTLVTEGETSITVTGIDIDDYGITFTGDSILSGDALSVYAYAEASTVSYDVYLYIRSSVTEVTVNKNVLFNNTSYAFRNKNGVYTFTWNATTSRWTATLDGSQKTFTQTALNTELGISYTLFGSATAPNNGDIISLNINIITNLVVEVEDYVGPNKFTVSFGVNEEEIEANKELWRTEITSSGTYVFKVNEYSTIDVPPTSQAYVAKTYTLSKNGVQVLASCNPANYGLVIDGETGRKDAITVEYSVFQAGTILVPNPTAFKSVGTNQFHYTDFVSGYKISNNQIVAGTSSDYIAWVHACYSDEQGWELYSSAGFGNIEVGWSDEQPTTADPVVELDDNIGVIDSDDPTKFHLRTDLGGASYDTAGEHTAEAPAQIYNFYIPEGHTPGYIIIYMNASAPAVSNTNGVLCVHPRWTGYMNTVNGYSDTTNYDDHTTTLKLPHYGKDVTTEEWQELPLGSYGMPRVGHHWDTLEFDSGHYVKRIDRLENTPANMEYAKESGREFIYDTNYIFIARAHELKLMLDDYVPSGVTYYTTEAMTTSAGTTSAVMNVDSVEDTYVTITVSGTTYYVDIDDAYVFNSIYIVSDFGTEEYLGTTVPVYSISLYGQNLRDKLRTDVVTITPQDLTESQKAQARQNLGITGAVIELTQAQYDALAVKDPNAVYYITDGTVNYPTASLMRYDNTESGLEATNVQDAIDENSNSIDEINATLSIVIDSSGWSATTTTINGTDYYIYTVNLSAIYTEHPYIGINPLNSAVLPSEAEKTAYNSVDYFTVDDTNMLLEAYAQSVPEDDFGIIVKGVA